MTATYLSSMSVEAHPILLDNLREEVADCHPAMLRKFAVAAHAFPTDKDALDIDADLTKVRLFLGRLGGMQNLLTMAFFESYIQRFMSYLAELARLQGSTEMVYTDVHGVCDVAHSEGLFQATASEMVINPPDPAANLFEGVDLLRALLERINSVDSKPAAA
jgi:CRP-like cAMP-binding protein